MALPNSVWLYFGTVWTRWVSISARSPHFTENNSSSRTGGVWHVHSMRGQVLQVWLAKSRKMPVAVDGITVRELGDHRR